MRLFMKRADLQRYIGKAKADPWIEFGASCFGRDYGPACDQGQRRFILKAGLRASSATARPSVCHCRAKAKDAIRLSGKQSRARPAGT